LQSNEPFLSIIIEWENAVLASEKRPPELLRRLRAELENTKQKIEVIFVFDPVTVPQADLKSLIEGFLGSEGRLVEWRLCPIEGSHYYGLKNHGAAEASANYILMIDSDVIPEPGWLASHVAFIHDRPDVSLCGGNTFIEADSLVSKAFAAGWFFPLRGEGKGILEPAPFVFANNCLFRRADFLAHPYRETEAGETRGACGRQAAEFVAAGLKTAINTSAQVSHPPPNGVTHFVTRGLAEGRDHILGAVATEKRSEIALAVLKNLRHVGRRLWQAFERVLSPQGRKAMKMGLYEAPVHLTIIAAYYVFYICGAWFTILFPRRARQLFRI
jgi:hypothetical protein